MTKTRQRKQNLLTARTIETAKESGRYSDGNGLYLVVRDGGRSNGCSSTVAKGS